MDENMEMTPMKSNKVRKYEILAFTVLPFFISLIGLGFIVAWSFVSATTKVQTGLLTFAYIAGVVFLSLLLLVGAYIACWFLTKKKKTIGSIPSCCCAVSFYFCLFVYKHK